MALTYREITGLWSARVPDGPDSDAHPDTVLLEGRVTFEPEYRVPLVYPGEHIVIEPMHAVIHEGVLYGETVVGDDVVRGPLFLPVTVDEAANQSWSWMAKFQGMRLGEYGEEVTLPTVRFQVPAGDDALDLSAVFPVSQSGGTITLRGPAGPGLTDIVAEDGQLTMLWDGGGSRTIPVPDAVPGPTGPRGPQGPTGTVELVGGAATITVDRSVGTRVMIGTEMVCSDTGWRDVSSTVQFHDTYVDITGSPSPLFRVRRRLNVVEFRVDFRGITSSTMPSSVSPIVSGIPVGFRVGHMRESILDGSNFTGPIGMVSVSGASAVGRLSASGAGRLAWFSGFASTSDAWPTVLPGTAA